MKWSSYFANTILSSFMDNMWSIFSNISGIWQQQRQNSTAAPQENTLPWNNVKSTIDHQVSLFWLLVVFWVYLLDVVPTIRLWEKDIHLPATLRGQVGVKLRRDMWKSWEQVTSAILQSSRNVWISGVRE